MLLKNGLKVTLIYFNQLPAAVNLPFIFILVPFVHQEGHILTRNHGNPDIKDTPPQFPLVQNQCIDYERFKPLFEFLTNWGTGEIGPTLAERAFKVSE